MILHVEHVQAMQQGRAWCGVTVEGPRIVGLESLAYHTGTAGICRECFAAIVVKLQEQLTKTQNME